MLLSIEWCETVDEKESSVRGKQSNVTLGLMFLYDRNHIYVFCSSAHQDDFQCKAGHLPLKNRASFQQQPES